MVSSSRTIRDPSYAILLIAVGEISAGLKERTINLGEMICYTLPSAPSKVPLR